LITMDIFLSILAIILMLVGLAGAILPIIPGPVISYLGLLSVYFLTDDPLTDQFMIVFAVIAVIVTAIDQVVPILGTKKNGRKQIWCQW
jgi:uncharacterized protein YqgC (DUF456 family)